MSFRNRLTVSAALAVAVAVALSSGTIYLAARRELRSQVDQALLQRVHELTEGDLQDERYSPPPLGAAGGYTQIVGANGSSVRAADETISIPVSESARRVATGENDRFFTDMEVSGIHVRVLTTPLSEGTALQVARPLDEVNVILNRLSILLVMIATAGVALAAALGRLVAQSALVPVHRLTEGAERIAETRSLVHRIDAGEAQDELGRLASSFNSMLDALDEAQKSQRQLVADASHELRTPLTSLRTNIEVLARSDNLPEEEKEELLADLTGQITELTGLVGDLMDLARDDEPSVGVEEVRLDRLVARVIDRVKKHWPGVEFDASLKPSLVRGAPSRLDRAVGNLLENAGKWSPPQGRVEVKVSGGQVTVRDQGPGIAEEDLPHIFDRFYRASDARSLPGSGLGLAIVQRVAQAHGGTVEASRADDGGSVLTMSIPPLPFTPAPDGPGPEASADQPAN
ncbi:MAG: HAMP domain-containing histidine kinase [Actinobacteria bacterium]|nr:HAMP domain-containing histidine kinase [Actinomycetota bacterium]